MDILFVRTKLQAIIGLELINRGHISKNFIFVKNFWNKKNEDSDLLSYYYSRIEEKSSKTYYFIEKSGILSNTILIFYLSLVAIFSGGKFFFASINLYSFAITKFINPFLKVNTFDDGFANINKESIYFKNTPLPHQKFNLKRILANTLFPKGPSGFLRKKAINHFTIYPNKENILSNEKIIAISISWKDLVTEHDVNQLIDFQNKEELNILIGTTFLEHSINFVPFLKRNYSNKFDLIIAHPRDNSEVSNWIETYDFESVSESIIDFLRHHNDALKINLYHFRSSTIHSYTSLEDNLNFIDLWDEAEKCSSNPSINNKLNNILIYIDTIPHLRLANHIIKHDKLNQYFFITSNPLIIQHIQGSNYFYVSSIFNIIRFAYIDSKKYQFDTIMAAQVDLLAFQILFKLMKFQKLQTFDEGLFTIQNDSIYNSQDSFKLSDGWKRYLSSRFFNFPIPAKFFYINSTKHFTIFNKSSFSNSVISEDIVHELNIQNSYNTIKKIFIGQPWHFMYFTNDALIRLASYINNNHFDLYLVHPRENDAIFGMLDKKISILHSQTSTEEFVNKLLEFGSIEIYSIASTLAACLNKNAQIFILESKIFDNRIQKSQQNLRNALRDLEIDYQTIKI